MRLNTKKVPVKKFQIKTFEPLEMKFSLNVAVDSIDMMKIAIKSGADSILFGGESYHHQIITPEIYVDAIKIAHDFNKKIFISTPRIVRMNQQL